MQRYAGRMTPDAEDPLSWEGDEDAPKPARSLPRGWNAVGKGSEGVGRTSDDHAVSAPTPPDALSTPMLLALGVIAGIYLLYTVGWIIGGFNLQARAQFLIPGVMYLAGLWTAVLAPALWFAAVWLLTRRSASWVRILGFLAGVALLVPWPFVMTGAVGP